MSRSESFGALLSRSVPRDYGTREEEEMEGREEREEEEEEEEKEETTGGGGEAEKKRKSAHINTYATQTKTHKGPRSWQIRSCGMQIRAY